MSFEKLLNKTCTIQEKSTSQTGTGQKSVAWADKALLVPCRANVNRSANVQQTIGQNSVINYTFYFSITTDITEADRIIFDGETFDILLVAKDSSEHHLEVLASTKFTD